MSDKKRLFGTFGVRRTANDVMTPEFANSGYCCSWGRYQNNKPYVNGSRKGRPFIIRL